MQKRWNILESRPPEFAAQCGDIHPVIPQLLWHRGVRNPEDIEQFFSPSYEKGIHDPFLFLHMQEAVDRVLLALQKGERICVFGDYDADGLTGSAVVLSTLKEVQRVLKTNAPVRSYIPHRDEEGYGLQMFQVDRFLQEGIDLLITVDCGISCPNEIAKLRANHADVLVIDHHQFGEVLPDAICIHPNMPGETYPNKHLAAAGVAWKFASALIAQVRMNGGAITEGFEKWLLDFVAIATVTDIVPLTGENRVLETYGLKVLNKTKRPGFKALYRNAGLEPGSLRTRDIGFMIGPRLNAPSRVDHARVGLELLLAETDEHAQEVADKIELLNRKRQETTLVMMKEAEELLPSDAQDACCHVLFQEHWSPSLVGLVAGRISDRFGTPVIAIGKCGAQWIGSGRSFSFYNITEAVRRVGEGLLTRSGGHVQACGFALEKDEHVHEFAARLKQDAIEQLAKNLLGPFIDVHAEVALQEIDWKLVGTIEQLEPYGCGNPEPVFMTRGARVVTRTTVGKDAKHLRIVVKNDQGVVQPFIAFGFGPRIAEVVQNEPIELAFTIGTNIWNGSRDIQCKVVDLRSGTAMGSTS